MGTFRYNTDCPHCGGTNSVGVYDDGEFCFRCLSLSSRTEGTLEANGKKAKTNKILSWPVGSHESLPSRGLTAQTCVKYDVRTFGPYVAFPKYENGKVVGIKTRNFLFSKSFPMHMTVFGTYNGLWGWHTAHNSKIIAIALGEFDAMSIYQATGIACLSPCNGDGSLVNAVKRDFERLDKFERVFFIPDRDKNMDNPKIVQPSKAVAAAIEILGVDRCYVATPSLDDPNEYLQKGQQKLLKELFWSARPQAADLFLSDFRNKVANTAVGFSSGINSLDMAIRGFREAETTYIIGAPSVGKTSFSTFLQYSIAKANSGHVKQCAIILEGKPDKYISKLVTVFTGAPTFSVSRDLLERAADDVEENILVPDLKGTSSMDDIATAIRAAVRVFGVKLVLVDNITAISSGFSATENAASYVRMFDSLASDLNIHIVIVSHVGRDSYNEEPKLGSGALTSTIERMAYNIIGLYRPNEDEARYNIGELKVVHLKCREYGERQNRYSLFYQDNGRYLEGARAQEFIL